MIVAYVSVQTKANAGSEFERIIREIQAEVRQIQGCAKNEWYRDPDMPGRYTMYGEFYTREHFEAYLKSDMVERIGKELIPLLESPPAFRHYEATVLDES